MTNSVASALSDLGVAESTLTEAERNALDHEGYVVLEGVMDAGWLDELRERYEYLLEREGAAAGIEVHHEKGTRRLADLVNKGEVFDGMYTNPRVLACVSHVLGRDFKLSSLNARDAEPGAGLQGLHADWTSRRQGEPYHVVNSIWLLDNFTPENGATRVVPGTHVLDGSRGGYVDDLRAPHPDEKLIVAPAGSVAVFNAHLWHGGTLNRTTVTRRACHCYFAAREHPQQLDQREYIRKTTYDRISAAARYVLEV